MSLSQAACTTSKDEHLEPAFWESLWAQAWDAREGMYVGEAHLGYWQERAPDFADGRTACDYDFGRQILKALAPMLPLEAEVLDVGSGPGSLLIPFCQAGFRVTAIEPVKGMIQQLKSNAALAGVDNYAIIPRLWQEVNTEALTGSVDLAISAITMWMFRDLRMQLERLERASRDLCCVVSGAGSHTSGHSDELWRAVMGKSRQPSYSVFPLVFNLLYAMGRFPEVRIVEYKTERSVESKIRQLVLFYAKYTPITPKITSVIEEHVKASSDSDMVKEHCRAAAVFWESR